MLQVVCSICGEHVPISDMQVEEALELIDSEDENEDYSFIFGRALDRVIGANNA